MMRFDPKLADALMLAPKQFLPGVWQTPPGAEKLTVGLFGDAANLDRLQCRFTISDGSIDKVSFVLCMRILGYRQMSRIYALDWNPTTPHSNPFVEGHPYSGFVFKPGETHEHDYRFRATDENPDKMALPVSVALTSYDSALDYFCTKTNIVDASLLNKPPSQGRLL